MHPFPKSFIVGLSVLLIQGSALAAAPCSVSLLDSFLNEQKTGQAQFKQTEVSSAGGSPKRQSNGILFFERPNKLRWVTEKPYKQLLVANEKETWMWDEEMKQATHSKGSLVEQSALGALIGGGAIVSKRFNVRAHDRSEGACAYTLSSKDKESSLTELTLKMDERSLISLSFKDNFGNQSTIEFSTYKGLLKEEASALFDFVPPLGTDVTEASRQ